MRTIYPSQSLEKIVGPESLAMLGVTKRQPALPLSDEEAQEVLEFLAVRPLHTAIMAGKIRDNGIENPLNRGTFYAYRNTEGILEGVALIGHATLIEARSPQAVKNLARCARNYRSAHLIAIEQEQFYLFWSVYADGGQPLRILDTDLLFEIRWPASVFEPVPELRLATFDDLEQVERVQAEMTIEQCHMNPLKLDPQGFRERLIRRIEQGRVYVLVQDGRLIFKADVLADTPEMVYLEGVWVNPEERRRGLGLRCVSQLSREMLNRVPCVCVFAKESNVAALNFYRRIGFKVRSCYKFAYLERV